MNYTLIIGRYQPITIIHEKMIKLQLQKTGQVVVQVQNGQKSSQDKYKNPFTFEERKRFIKEVFPENNVIVVEQKTGYIPDLIKDIEENNDNITITKYICGEDRYEGYKRQLEKEGLIDRIELIMLPRDIDSQDNVSQTKLRLQLYQGDLQLQKKYLPKQLHSLIEDISNIIKERWNEYFKQKPRIQKRLGFVTEGITHIDDLKIQDFIYWLENLLYNSESLIQSIKYDGIQNISFTFNRDEIKQGRVGKGKKELISSIYEYPKNPIYNQFRSQFSQMEIYFEKYKELFRDFLNEIGENEFTFECEIVSPIYSNIIQYQFEESGQLFVIRQLNKVDENTFNKFVNDLVQLPPVDISVGQYIIDEETLEIKLEQFNEKWKINSVEKIKDFKTKYLSKIKNELEQKLNEIKQFLDEKPLMDDDELPEELREMTVFDILTISLQKVKKQYRDKIKKLREEYNDKSSNLIGDIKQLLLKYVNEEIENEKGSDIEGIVIRDPNGNQIKVVDKDYFTSLNKQQWSILDTIDYSIRNYFEIKPDEGIIPLLKKNFIQILKGRFIPELNHEIQNKDILQLRKLQKKEPNKQIETLLEWINKYQIYGDKEMYTSSFMNELDDQINKLIELKNDYKNKKLIYKQKKSGSGKVIDKDVEYVKSKMVNSILLKIRELKNLKQRIEQQKEIDDKVREIIKFILSIRED